MSELKPPEERGGGLIMWLLCAIVGVIGGIGVLVVMGITGG